jgi:DinB family protein
MPGRPGSDEAAPYYFRYIDRIAGNDPLAELETQLDGFLPLLNAFSEESSLARYAADKWSVRQVWSHVNDSERVFVSRAFWFARGFDSALPGFDEKPCAAAARADEISWAAHVAEFGHLRRSTVAFFRHLPDRAWDAAGVASGNPFTVRALAYIVAGHADHHASILRERYTV